MATLLNCQALSKHYASRELFRELSIAFTDDEHVGFLGPNGAGKSTFLRILAGQVEADGGDISRRRGARICLLAQEDRFDPSQTVESAVAAAITDPALEEHERDTKVSIVLTKCGFERPDQRVEELSGGWRKRLALARQFVQEPALLLLDEPTNHLDLEGIEWLEETLQAAPFAFVAVSHDRYFLDRVTDRVVELNPVYPEGYFSVSGSYSVFLEKRAEYLESRQAMEASLAGIVRRETAFLKSNSKAQRTKSKWRIDEAYRLTDEFRDLQRRNTQTASAGIDFEGTGRQSKKLLHAKNVSKSLGGRLLFKDVSIFLSPGSRLGLLGANGSGKTTLIRVLTGVLPPDEGTVESAQKLRVVLFDQRREELPQDIPLRQALAGKRDSVEFAGQNIHVTAWAKRFLFRLDQLDTPVGELSGGEQARIFIARLMLQPADLLILDEPTNDLDIASLDALEESLMEFPGAIVLVTHDRFMLDRICTEIIGLHDDGRVGQYGSCAQWVDARAARQKEAAAKGKPGKAAHNAATAADAATAVAAAASGSSTAGASAGKRAAKSGKSALTSREKNELAAMEATIAAAEARIAACTLALEDPTIASNPVETQKRWTDLESAKAHAKKLYARWLELEEKLA